MSLENMPEKELEQLIDYISEFVDEEKNNKYHYVNGMPRQTKEIITDAIEAYQGGARNNDPEPELEKKKKFDVYVGWTEEHATSKTIEAYTKTKTRKILQDRIDKQDFDYSADEDTLIGIDDCKITDIQETF